MDLKTLVTKVTEGDFDPEGVAEAFDQLPEDVREALDVDPKRLRGGETTTSTGLVIPQHLFTT